MQALRDARPAHLRHPLELSDVGDRQDPRDDRDLDPNRPGPLDELEVALVVEEHLRDQEVHARLHLLRQVFEVLLGAARVDVRLREAGRRDHERVVIADQRDQLAGVLEATLGHRPLRLAARGIAPQGEHVVDARSPELVERLPQLTFGGPHAGEVGHRLEAVLGLDPLHDLDRLRARRSSGPVGHRHERGLEVPQLLERLIEVVLPLLRLRREELEREHRLGSSQQPVDPHRAKPNTIVSRLAVRGRVAAYDSPRWLSAARAASD